MEDEIVGANELTPQHNSYDEEPIQDLDESAEVIETPYSITSYGQITPSIH